MSNFSMILFVLALVISVISLIYTFRVGRDISVRRSKFDGPVSEKVQEHPYIRNPVFLSFLIAGLLSVGYLFYLLSANAW